MYYAHIVRILTKLKYWNVTIPKCIFIDLLACQLSPNSIQHNPDKKKNVLLCYGRMVILYIIIYLWVVLITYNVIFWHCYKYKIHFYAYIKYLYILLGTLHWFSFIISIVLHKKLLQWNIKKCSNIIFLIQLIILQTICLVKLYIPIYI